MHRRSGPVIAVAPHAGVATHASMFNAGLRIDLFMRDAFGMCDQMLSQQPSLYSLTAVPLRVHRMLTSLNRFYDAGRQDLPDQLPAHAPEQGASASAAAAR